MKNVLLAILLVGCQTQESRDTEAKASASFDHDCPVEKIQVIKAGSDDGNYKAKLNVCGKIRLYKLRPYKGWIDETNSIQDM